MPIDTPSQILTVMITPAVLISASGTLALSTSNRLGRVVDRVRVLADLLESDTLEHAKNRDAKRGLYLAQLEHLSERMILLQSALTMLYTAISLFVGTSIAVAVLTLASEPFGWAAVSMGLIGAVALLYGSIRLIKEARIAVRMAFDEMTYVKHVTERYRREHPLGGG